MESSLHEEIKQQIKGEFIQCGLVQIYEVNSIYLIYFSLTFKSLLI